MQGAQIQGALSTGMASSCRMCWLSDFVKVSSMAVMPAQGYRLLRTICCAAAVAFFGALVRRRRMTGDRLQSGAGGLLFSMPSSFCPFTECSPALGPVLCRRDKPQRTAPTALARPRRRRPGPPAGTRASANPGACSGNLEKRTPVLPRAFWIVAGSRVLGGTKQNNKRHRPLRH